MAPFNPPVPDQPDPRYYLHLSHPIQQPEFKSAAATALKDTGNIIEQAAKGADSLVDKAATKEAYDVASGERQAYSDALTAVAPVAEGKQPSLVSDTTTQQPLPKEIQNLPSQLQAYDSARKSGKISETDYYARMDKLASDVRGRYPPAYREAIDRVFSQVTGGDPANQYIKSLLGDINSYLGGKDKAVEDAMSVLKAHPGIVPNWSDLVTGLRSGKYTPADVLGQINKPLSDHYRLTQRDLELTSGGKERADVKSRSEDLMSDVANTELNKTFNVPLPGLPSREGIETFISDVQAGRKKVTPEEQRDMMGAIQAYRSQWEANVRKEFSRVRSDGSTLLTAGGPDKAEEVIKNQKKAFDWMEDAISNKDTGTMFRTKQMLPAFQANSAYNLLTHKDLGPMFTVLAGVKELGGDAALQSVFVQRLMQDKLPDMDTFIKFIGGSTVTGLPGPGGSTPKNFGDAATQLFNEARKQGIDASKAYDGLFKYIETVKDQSQDPRFRQAIADKMFGPDNANFTKLFKSDITDPNNPKRVISGAEGLFNRFTAPDFVESIKQLGPETFDKYVNWVKTSWEQDLAHRGLQSLGEMNMGGPDQKIQIIYHDSTESKTGNPSFSLNVNGQPFDPSRRMSLPMEKKGYLNILNVLAGVNKGLDGLGNVAKGSGEQNVDAYVLQSLFDALPPDSRASFASKAATMQGMPEAVVKAIISSRQAAEKKAEEAKEEKGKMFR